MQSRIILSVFMALGLAACSAPKSPSINVSAVDALQAVEPHLEMASQLEAKEIIDDVVDLEVVIGENEDKNKFEIEVDGVKALVELVDSVDVAIRVNGYDISPELFQNEAAFKQVLMNLLIKEETASLSNLMMPKAHAFIGGGIVGSLLGLVLRGAVNYVFSRTRFGQVIGDTVRPIVDGVVDRVIDRVGGDSGASDQIGLLPGAGQGGQDPTNAISGVFGRLMDLFGGLFGRR